MADGEKPVQTVVREIVRGVVRDAVRNFVTFILLGALIACSKPPQPETAETPPATGLETIPAPAPSKYPKFSDMPGGKNPYLVVRDGGIGLVDLSSREVRSLSWDEIPTQWD